MITRFAPSPTGPLHLGHACSALLAHDMARAAAGRFLIRFEDIDRQRARPEWEEAALADLSWLGIHADAPPLRQSTRLPAHREALQHLWDIGLLYPCQCTRRDIEEALSAPQESPAPRTACDDAALWIAPKDRHGPGATRNPDRADADHSRTGATAAAPVRSPAEATAMTPIQRTGSRITAAPASGPGGPLYPGTCRNLPRPQRMPDDMHLRLDMAAALDRLGGRSLSFTETGPVHAGETTVTATRYRQEIGDIILARRDCGTSYHLAVTLDDAAQQITHVVRGVDLFPSTAIHILLQAILGLSTPIFYHHRLIRDEQGRRLAKRDHARALSRYREDGATPEDIRRMAGL